AVEENSLVAVRDAEILTHLFRRPALDVAKRDHCSLHSRQRLDRFEHRGAQLARHQALLGNAVPARHCARPHAGPATLVEEPVATHAEVRSPPARAPARPPARAPTDPPPPRARAHGQEPLLLLRPPSRTVAENRVDPSPK